MLRHVSLLHSTEKLNEIVKEKKYVIPLFLTNMRKRWRTKFARYLRYDVIILIVMILTARIFLARMGLGKIQRSSQNIRAY